MRLTEYIHPLFLLTGSDIQAELLEDNGEKYGMCVDRSKDIWFTSNTYEYNYFKLTNPNKTTLLFTNNLDAYLTLRDNFDIRFIPIYNFPEELTSVNSSIYSLENVLVFNDKVVRMFARETPDGFIDNFVDPINRVTEALGIDFVVNSVTNKWKSIIAKEAHTNYIELCKEKITNFRLSDRPDKAHINSNFNISNSFIPEIIGDQNLFYEFPLANFAYYDIPTFLFVDAKQYINNINTYKFIINWSLMKEVTSEVPDIKKFELLRFTPEFLDYGFDILKDYSNDPFSNIDKVEDISHANI